MTEVRRGDVGGVPAFWVDSGRPTLTAALVFRHGMVDESLPTTGWTHLLEHLALHGQGGGSLHVNGSVSLLHTRFDAYGPVDRVAAALSAVSRWLADPDFAELAREQSVLRAEATFRGRGEVNQALLQRYGARGPGLSAYAEPGLSRANPESLRDLAQRVFVAQNCALFLDGPPPAALTLGLSSGRAHPTPAALPCGDTLPAGYLIGAGITLSGVVRRSVAATFLPHVLREVLTAEFRERDGGAYAPWAHYEPVDADAAVVVCGSDANDQLLRTIASTGMAQVERVSRGEFADDLVGNIREQLVQAATDPFSLPTLAYRAATDHLCGRPPLTLEQSVAEIESVTTEDVIAEAEHLRDSLLVGIAGQATWKRDVPMLCMPSGGQRVQGRARRSRNFPANREALRVGVEGVQVGTPREYRTVRHEEVVGMFAYPDGGREVIADDGWSIRVEPTMWAGGQEAIRRLDEVVPASLHIPMLDRDRDMVPQPLSVLARLRHVVHDLRRRPRAMLAVWGTLWLVVVVGRTVATGTPPVTPIVVTLVLVGVSARRARASLRRE